MRPYGHLNDLTVDEICDRITSTRESLAGYIDLLHTYALKINPRRRTSCPECSAQPWRPHREDCELMLHEQQKLDDAKDTRS